MSEPSPVLREDQLRGLVDDWLAAHTDSIVEWRRHLHSHPELSYAEHRTTAFVVDTLRAAGIEPRLLSLTGLLVDLGPKDGPRIALRADLDALPIPEETGLECASTVPGVSHACGHDMHTAILLAAVLALHAARREGELPVGVRAIFQPAEEAMGGAASVVDEGGLEGIDCAFALHCDPMLSVGRIGMKAGPITSAADRLHLSVTSPGGHSARPHLTGDVVYALATVVTQLPSILSRRVDPRSGTVLVIGAINAGNAPNAIPQEGMLRGTLRCADRDVWRTLEPLVTDAVESLLSPLNVDFDFSYRRGVPPVVNDTVATDVVLHAIDAREEDALASTPQSSGGEDFAWYLEHVPGAMARLGVWDGHSPKTELHQPDFTADERALPIGARFFTDIVGGYGEVLATSRPQSR